MMNGLNILPTYTDYFTLTTATLALNTASVWMGSVLSVFYAKVPDWVGRKWALFFGAVITIIGVVLQTASQNIAMFVVARIIIGFGTGASSIAGPVYLAETLPVRYRAWGLGIFYDFCGFPLFDGRGSTANSQQGMLVASSLPASLTAPPSSTRHGRGGFHRFSKGSSASCAS